ncbi:dienelactone hydrolase family protein [Streptomyces griseorubiginosus]|uniref:dienelactone hydrolase family protein n=1 Tax=Streptomyces griseorubiginosus TaxID=67304 RepID=UPI001AD7AFF5|nr:dienelactone hydrolase family protein [Streptomyces griseorubiginosus]MBO4255144.1 dienelactone hydrolase family protein [Streptomyces griseorubiginosus]
MTSVQGTAVDITTEDGVADAYVAHAADGSARPGVLMYMDAFGLRPHLKSMADRLAEAGYTVLVPNVFYRAGRSPVFDLPEFIDPSARPQLFDQIMPVMQALTPERAKSDAGAYLQWLADSPLVADGPVAVTGYCMGARLLLYTAGAYPDRVAAAAGFHGGRLATDTPDSPHLEAEHVTAELYFGHADEDPSMPPEQQQLLEETLTGAGVRHRCEVYAGAPHGYTQADTAAYHKEGDERHWAALLDLLDRTF